MKILKGISLFFVYPVFMLGLGFCLGIKSYGFFYPGPNMEYKESPAVIREELKDLNRDKAQENRAAESEKSKQNAALMVSKGNKAVITADTEYVLEEADLNEDTVVQTKWSAPEKYIGMSREEFLTAMEEYELTPPLSELERGFVSAEVRSFAADKVVVRMNYAYVEPSKNFYLAAEDNYVVVYCDDKETVYMNTDILLESLSDDLQQKIIGMMYIEDEEALYYFLESYSS